MLTRIAAVFLLVLSLVACGASPDDRSGRLVTVPCSNGVAVIDIGESWEDTEASTWLVDGELLAPLASAGPTVDAAGRISIACPGKQTTLELFVRD